MFFYRCAPSRGVRFRPGFIVSGGVAILGASVEALSAWKTCDHIVHGVAPGDALSASIVHAVGTPVLGASGPRLKLSDPSPSPAAGLLDRSMLPDRLPLLILQQEAADGPVRTGSDREQASLLRATAAELFDADGYAVITIPSLPPELAFRVVATIARSVTRGHGSAARVFRWIQADDDDDFLALVHGVRDARQLVRSWPGFGARGESLNAQARESDARTEAAWDICLFARYASGLERRAVGEPDATAR